MGRGRDWMLGALLLLSAGSCGGNSVEATQLVLTPGSCDTEKITHVHSVQVLLQPLGQQSDCFALEPKTLEALQSGLASRTAFRGIGAGSYTLIIRGYDDKLCERTVLVCGMAPFVLPAAQARVTIPVDCYGGPSPPATFARCVGK